jgi:flagellar protein FliO/FliZ
MSFRRYGIGLVGLASSCIVLSAWAVDVAPQQGPSSQSSFFSLLQVLFGLGLVLGAIAGTAWVLRRLSPGQVSDAGALRVVGGVAVGTKERVVLVDVGSTRLVLGVAPGSVELLHQMPRPDDETTFSTPMPLPGMFQEKLKAMLTRSGTKHDA